MALNYLLFFVGLKVFVEVIIYCIKCRMLDF